jgi:hypothetical protein
VLDWLFVKGLDEYAAFLLIINCTCMQNMGVSDRNFGYDREKQEL